MQYQRRPWWLDPLILLLLFTVALTVRVYGLQLLPPGLYNDEAANGVDALAVLHGDHAVFFPRNTGREPLFIYLQAGLIALMGQTPLALRMTAALLGALTVPATYLMVRAAFPDTRYPRWLALWTALFLAVGYWHVSLSRIAFRAIALPLFATVTFALFWWSWRRVTAAATLPWFGLVATGAALGLTLYTYTAARFVPLVVALLMLVTLVQQWRTGEARKRVLVASGTIVATSLLVFAPLGLYFWAHPDAFLGRALSISVLNEGYAGRNPAGAMAWAAWETAKMFVVAGDQNLRHNPAQRPILDPLLGLWLAAGIILALARARRRAYLFVLSWFLILAVPALVSAEGVPHALRAVGMMPAVYLLPVLAITAAGDWIRTRFGWRSAPVWLPLPFFVVSAVVGLGAYFSLLSQPERLRAPFLADYVHMAGELAAIGTPDDVWIIPLSPNYHLADARFYTIDYIYDGPADQATILVDPDTVGQRLRDAVAGHTRVRLLRTQDSRDYVEASYILGDPKNLLKYLFDKYGRYVATENDAIGDLDALIYTVPPDVTFQVYDILAPQDVAFDSRVKLAGVDFGPTAGSRGPQADVNAGVLPSGDELWAVLAWEALAPIDVDLKTSLALANEDGHVVGRSDDLLVGDRYPVERVWEEGERAMTYHILPVAPGTPPGRYALNLRVYEDATGRPYPVLAARGGTTGLDARIGTVVIGPSTVPTDVAPSVTRDLDLGDGIVLRGHDPLLPEIAPGASLDVTLYWRAETPPAQAHAVTLDLRDVTGQVVAARTDPLAGNVFPTTAWRAGEGVRTRHRLVVPATAASGVYTATLSLHAAGTDATSDSDGPIVLADVAVQGRPRVFAVPSVTVPRQATFGQAVQLRGTRDALPDVLSAGEDLELALVWQVMTPPPQDLVRFVHLLDVDGRPVAQLDGVPCAGACPSPTWLAGEVLMDDLTLAVPAAMSEGSYRLGLGWYDANTLLRLPVRDELGNPLPDDLFVFPAAIQIGRND